MDQLAAIIDSDKFKQDQIDFFKKYCSEFEDEEENKLCYTQIHNEYEEQVEGFLEAALGEEVL